MIKLCCVFCLKSQPKKRKVSTFSPGRQAPSHVDKKATTRLSLESPEKPVSNPASLGAKRLQGVLRAQFSVVTLSLLRYFTATSQVSLSPLNTEVWCKFLHFSQKNPAKTFNHFTISEVRWQELADLVKRAVIATQGNTKAFVYKYTHTDAIQFSVRRKVKNVMSSSSLVTKHFFQFPTHCLYHFPRFNNESLSWTGSKFSVLDTKVCYWDSQWHCNFIQFSLLRMAWSDKGHQTEKGNRVWAKGGKTLVLLE